MPSSCDILLTTLNARYIHCAFGLRYLQANLGEMQSRSWILEFTIHQRPLEVAEMILRHQPKVIGIGVYIWNINQTASLVAHLKRLRPDLIIVLGGPEVSHETEEQDLVKLADYVITGEGDLAFAELCGRLLAGEKPEGKVITAVPPDFSRLVLPYDLYTDEDLAHRVIYVEASRGCPFECEFCLSSLDIPVRAAPLDGFLQALQKLYDRGARQFKFVDRTFNLNIRVGTSILDFFYARYEPGLFVHFEMIPDRLPDALRESILRFPEGALQFEVGIQTFNEEVSGRISRRQDHDKAVENLKWLRTETGVHVHVDLIVGLPGETLESFGNGFDRLAALRPQEIQVGILKRLRGTPIKRHDREWGMVYSPEPPFEILQNRDIDFFTMQRMRRFARYWDLVGNSGNFVETVRWFLEGGSPFATFLRLSDQLYEELGRTHEIARSELARCLRLFLISEGKAAGEVEAILERDARRAKKSKSKADAGPKRQARHRTLVEGEGAGRINSSP